METNFNSFFDAYLTCMLWSSAATDNEGADHEGLEDFELSESATATAKRDCVSFMYKMEDLLPLPGNYNFSNAGHDFWLTRNGHGAGFWDRGLGELGDRLTELSKEYGSQHLYIGDDGLLYLG